MADDPSTLDLFVAAVLKVAGPEGLAKVHALAAGTNFTLPIFATVGARITLALGLDKARKVCAEMRVYGADGRPCAVTPFYFPKNQSFILQCRRDRIAEMYIEGAPKRDIAFAFGISERTVCKDLAQLRLSGKLPALLPRPGQRQSNGQVGYSIGSNRKGCGPASPSTPDHPANIGTMVPPADEVP